MVSAPGTGSTGHRLPQVSMSAVVVIIICIIIYIFSHSLKGVLSVNVNDSMMIRDNMRTRR